MKGAFLFFPVVCAAVLLNGCAEKKVFQLVPSSASGIHFNNRIEESDSLNVIDVQNIYNGGGVGIGDFNNDGLQDIYFTGNLVECKLYLNKGDFKFDDITAVADVAGKGRWCRGVAVVDINDDGWKDIYVCTSMLKDASQRENLLYINQGADKNGIPHFKEMAADYGLNDTTYTTMASFFDYDNDGDLDVFLSVNEIRNSQLPNVYKKQITDGSFYSTCRLYRNDWSDSLKHGIFTNISKQAGITIEGYSHGATVVDINQDGWKDIYVTNDFLSSNVLYINNRNGTFTDRSRDYFKHTSINAMGQDIADINNDGLADVIELDMNPEDNYRKKTMENPYKYQSYQYSNFYGYQLQYVRNTLQVNQGPRVLSNDTIGEPVFSETGFLSGIAETDWSWAPLVADFDNDGYRDIVVTNGFPKDVTDHDFTSFRKKSEMVTGKKYLLSQVPEIKLLNYAFQNEGNLKFNNVSSRWGIDQPSFSNGAAYADFDNDGNLDYVVNNINDEAFLYRNTSSGDTSHYLKIYFSSEPPNINGLGVCVSLFYDHGKQQVFENTPYRGYLSSVESNAHFGLGKVSVVDSLLVKWPDGKKQIIKNVKTDQSITVKHSDAKEIYSFQQDLLAKDALLKDVTDSLGIDYNHKEWDFIDFNIQKLLPHKFSEYGPALAVGDIDGNGLEDIIAGGSALYSARIFLQQNNNRFIQKSLLPDDSLKTKRYDDAGLLLFDADNNGTLDLFIASGGYENQSNSKEYSDHFYTNDGKGNFLEVKGVLPPNFTSKSCVRACDFDNDGDLDLFIAGRVDPWNYPNPVSSFIYRNDSQKGKIKFTDVTGSIAKDLTKIGMVCDALWTDFDNDGFTDLILAGEWMPLAFLKNDRGVFKNITAGTGILNETGWWNSIVAGDFDNDGDMDYIAGNLGENSYYRGSKELPAAVYAKDFDGNNSLDAIPTLFLKDQSGKYDEFPAQGRDAIVEQLPVLKKKFLTYKNFASADFHQMFSDAELKNALTLHAGNFRSSFIRNDGNDHFSIMPLPVQAQVSSIFGMVAEDADADGNLDIVLTGNDYSTEVPTGRYDALNGLILKGDGKGNFSPLSILQSGFYVPGNGKALVKLHNKNGHCLFAASQNRGALKIFLLKQNSGIIPVKSFDIYALLKLKNGKTRKEEFNYGGGFYSESGRFLRLNNNVLSATITDSKGGLRDISVKPDLK